MALTLHSQTVFLLALSSPSLHQPLHPRLSVLSNLLLCKMLLKHAKLQFGDITRFLQMCSVQPLFCLWALPLFSHLFPGRCRVARGAVQNRPAGRGTHSSHGRASATNCFLKGQTSSNPRTEMDALSQIRSRHKERMKLYPNKRNIFWLANS